MMSLAHFCHKDTICKDFNTLNVIISSEIIFFYFFQIVAAYQKRSDIYLWWVSCWASQSLVLTLGNQPGRVGKPEHYCCFFLRGKHFFSLKGKTELCGAIVLISEKKEENFEKKEKGNEKVIEEGAQKGPWQKKKNKSYRKKKNTELPFSPTLSPIRVEDEGAEWLVPSYVALVRKKSCWSQIKM